MKTTGRTTGTSECRDCGWNPIWDCDPCVQAKVAGMLEEVPGGTEHAAREALRNNDGDRNAAVFELREHMDACRGAWEKYGR